MQHNPLSRPFNGNRPPDLLLRGSPASSYTRSSGDARGYEEAWTQYDGLGPVQQQRRKDPRMVMDWRSGQAPNKGVQSRSPSRGRGQRQQERQAQQQQEQEQQWQTQQRRRRPSPVRNERRTGTKRKLSPALRHENLSVVDDEYLSQNFAPVPKSEYPDAPSTLFSNPKSFLWDTKGLSSSSSFVTRHSGWYTCTVAVKVPGKQPITAIGESQVKKNAERVACRHAVLLLHQSGVLKEMISENLVHEGANDKELLSDEQDAKMDIYDYCARFDTTPRFTAHMKSGFGRRSKPLIEVVTEMPEQGIRASAKALDRYTAEILACVEFKRQAEEFHAKHGDEDIVVKDVSNALNSRNARKFFDYYRIFHDKSATLEVRTKSLRGPGRLLGGLREGQAYLNGEPIGEPVQMVRKKVIESAAHLSGAMALKRQHPEMFAPFIEALKQGNGEILKPIQPTWLSLDHECTVAMTRTLHRLRRVGLPPTEEEVDAEDEAQRNAQGRRSSARRGLEPALEAEKNKKLLEQYEEYLADPKLESLRQKRAELPMNQYTSQVLELVDGNTVSIIVGATGSGKTTQVPQILLEQATKNGEGAKCNIICTQPRRIAATSVAQRVAVERNEPLRRSVGYHVRFDAKLPAPGGSVTYCTTGILLQQLRHSPDEVLDGITHLVIDEVHERDIQIDYLLIILKRVLKERRRKSKTPIRIVLMSATMDTELFAKYFRTRGDDGKFVDCPSLSVPGRTFPVKEHFLEDIQSMLQENYNSSQLVLLRSDPDTRSYLEVEQSFATASNMTASPKEEEEAVEESDDSSDAVINWKQEVTLNAGGASVTSEKEDALVPIGLAAVTMAHIAKISTDGAILVFLPGLDEILSLEEIICRASPLGVNFADTSKFRVYKLHSSIQNQNDVFEEVPEGVRKIILSTNIAETSITIPDVQYVVDAGKLREKRYEQARRITSLICTWVSRSNSKQRAGRAGRVQNGNYFALFTRARYNSLRVAGLPEMLRSDLQEICLDIKLQGFTDPVGEFLSEAIEPPQPHAIEASLRQLRALGALHSDEGLTALGRALATMPVEPALGKMIILAVIFRCLDPIIILGASAGGRDIFVNPPDRRQEANKIRRSFVLESGSDHIATINAYKRWRDIRNRDGPFAAQRFAEENFLHRGSLRVLDQTARQIEEILGEIRVIPSLPRGVNRPEFGDRSLNQNSNSTELVKALILAGMYPNIAICVGGRGFRTVAEAFTMVHPSSSHYSPTEMPRLGTVMTYSTKAKSNDGTTIMLRQNTESTHLAAILFGGQVKQTGNLLEIDNWLPFLLRDNARGVVTDFKRWLDRLLTSAFQSLYKRSNFSPRSLADDPAHEVFATGLVDVLEFDSLVRNPRSFSSRDSSATGVRGDSTSRPSSGFGGRMERPSSAFGGRPERPSSAFGGRPERPSLAYGSRADPPPGHSGRPERPPPAYGTRADPSLGFGSRPERLPPAFGSRPERPSPAYGTRAGPSPTFDSRPERPSLAYGTRTDPSPVFGSRPERPSPAYGTRTDPSPAYGTRTDPSPVFGSRPERPLPAYGTKAEPPPAFGSRPERSSPAFDSRPERPSPAYDTRADPSPAFSSRPEQPSPAYGTRADRSPTFDSRPERRSPAYGARADPPPAFSSRPERPSPAYNTRADRSPAFDSRPERPSSAYGTRADPSPAFGSRPERSPPVYGTRAEPSPGFDSRPERRSPAYGTGAEPSPAFGGRPERPPPALGTRAERSSPAFGGKPERSSTAFSGDRWRPSYDRDDYRDRDRDRDQEFRRSDIKGTQDGPPLFRGNRIDTRPGGGPFGSGKWR